MPRVVVPRTAKQAFVSLFSSVPPLLAVDAVRRATARAVGTERVGPGGGGTRPARRLLRQRIPAPAARTSPNLVGLQVGTGVGVALGLRFARRHPIGWGLAAAEALGWLVYTRWYSWSGREPSSALAIGATLPGDLPFIEHGHGPIAAAELRGQPTVLLFDRGTGAHSAWHRSARSPLGGATSRP